MHCNGKPMETKTMTGSEFPNKFVYKFVLHRIRISGEFNLKEESHSTKFQQRPLLVKLSFRAFVIQKGLVYILLIIWP